MRRLVAASAGALLLAAVAGCGSGGSPSGGTLTVYAASSLTDTFTTLGRRFEAAHPGTTVTFSFGGSSDLVAQLQQGAPADVFASADPVNMAKAVSAHVVKGRPVDFASNTLEIAVPPGNPADVHALADLADPSTKVVVCAPEVPCGAATQKVEKASGVAIKPVSEEQAVTDVLTKVESGEADAGLVYVTDVKGAGDKVEGVTFAQSSSAVNVYPIAALSDSRQQALAGEFIKLVTGPSGQRVLGAAGFAGP